MAGRLSPHHPWRALIPCGDAWPASTAEALTALGTSAYGRDGRLLHPSVDRILCSQRAEPAAVAFAAICCLLALTDCDRDADLGSSAPATPSGAATNESPIAMICEDCHGRGYVLARLKIDGQRIPCGNCGGCAFASCCDGACGLADGLANAPPSSFGERR